MNRKTTITDIARMAGVSDTTVSLCFQEDSRISARTRRKVHEIAGKLNYMPNVAAQRLRMGKTRTIGFVVTDITNPFYARMMRTAEEVSLRNGYQTLFGDSVWDSDKEVQIVENMLANRVQGILICFSEKSPRSYDLIRKASIPCLAVDTKPSFYEGPYVINDLHAAGYLAAGHLIEVGCVNPAFFGANKEMMSFSAFIQLKAGFTRCLAENGRALASQIIVDGGLTIERGRSAFSRFLSQGTIIDGVFCVNDLSSFGVIEAAERSGIMVGRDLAVIGIDNLKVSSISRISLSSIHQPHVKLMRIATRVLIDCIDAGKMPDIKAVLKPKLVKRSSTQLHVQSAPAAEKQEKRLLSFDRHT